jgi:hypothetical protein
MSRVQEHYRYVMGTLSEGPLPRQSALYPFGNCLTFLPVMR